jgi:cyclic beta-1,2-glucan synthetase
MWRTGYISPLSPLLAKIPRPRLSSQKKALIAEDPLRAELLSMEQLKLHAEKMARDHVVAVQRTPDRLLPRLAENARVLQESYDVVTTALAQDRHLAPATEWFLDNYYLIEQQIQMARLHLPRTYSRNLPCITIGRMSGFPRVYHMALDLIAHLDGRVDAETATNFVAAYQTVSPLRLGELWAFPIALRLGLIENLRRVASRIAWRRQQRDAGIAWAERMLEMAETAPKKLIHLLAEFAEAQPALTAPFVEEFCSRLQGPGSVVTFVLNWVEHALLEQETTTTELLHTDSRAQAAEQLSIANSIGSLRFLGAMNWKEFVEALSHVEQTLRQDPAGAYAMQDFDTRDRYRHIIESTARHSEREEWEVAVAAIKLAGKAADRGDPQRCTHVGYYLVDRGRRDLERDVKCGWSPVQLLIRIGKRYRFTIYLGMTLLITAAGTAAILPWIGRLGVTDVRFWLILMLAAFPASTLAVSLVNFLATLLIPPRPLPRFDYSNGIPSDHRTMVVIPSLLSSVDEVDKLLESIEIRYLGNRDINLFYALLSDFPDADTETKANDADLLRRAEEGITALNKRHRRDDGPAVFFLFHRPRVWNPIERIWMSYERKRGKLEQFNALIRGDPGHAFSSKAGDLSVLQSIKYVITLDADTELSRGAAHQMVGAMAHPLNRPRFDPAIGRVVEGYAILQPRASIRLTSANQSRFTRLYAGETGFDPYTKEVSDVYQDIFGEGSFVGKGIYDVDAFQQSLHGRFPENLILSHDLLESGFARSALLSGVEVFEDVPKSYLGEISRQHRWIRGDWQIAPWLFPRPPTGSSQIKGNPLSLLSRWKIFDNIRRSLFSPALLILLIMGWLMGPVPALIAIFFALGVLFITGILRALTQFLRKPPDYRWRIHFHLTGMTIARNAAQSILTLVFLPFEAFIHSDAIIRSGVRMPFSRHGLLIWHLPQYRRRNACVTLPGFFLEMWPAPMLALGAGLWLKYTQPAAFWSSAPLLALWILAPLVAWWISRPRRTALPALTTEQHAMLRMLSLRTWRYFETFVGPDDHWLPPDNFQEKPSPVIASRTSPTNIGLTLLSNLTAWDFGYITTGQLLDRTKQTLDSMARLERYQGHFFNWYDTRTLLPLRPMYVSSVDSGNLVGSLITLRTGLEELVDQSILPPQCRPGMQDTLAMLAAEANHHATPDLMAAIQTASKLLDAFPGSLDEVRSRLTGLQNAAAKMVDAATLTPSAEIRHWANAFERQCRSFNEDIERMMPGAISSAPPPSLNALATSTDLPEKVRQQAAERLREINQLSERCREFESAMDFRFLYDVASNLLSIGFDVDARRLDPGRYDLLASEARLISFLLIASEQVPPDHWFALGRLLTGHDGSACLISWSGSMFEYLMPALLMPHHENTLLEQTCRSIIDRQIRYGQQRDIPWGISESCYNARDVHHTYQYRAFGVPGLGLKRGLADDLVVAPYATMLALPFAPREACANLERLSKEPRALGMFGMYEAVDYTPTRVPRGKTSAVVQSFMTHHQGMGLIAIANLLLNGPMIRRFMTDPSVRATEVLLHERMPQAVPVLQPHPRETNAGARPAVADEGMMMRIYSDPNTETPEVHLLSNGNYHAMVTHGGGSYSRWHNLAITRWREDVTCDAWGTFVYLRDVEGGEYWSNAYQPTCRRGDHYEAIFTQGRAEFRRRDNEIESHTEICVSPEDDVEIRRITLSNLSRQNREMEITTYGEVVLAPLNADLAHRMFSNIFLHTEILEDRQAILCTRRKRSPEDATPWMFHLMMIPASGAAPSFETDRERFIGRCRNTANPAVMDVPAGQSDPLSNSEGAVLDPIVAIRNTVEVPTDKAILVYIVTGVAETREAAMALLDKYRDHHFVDRAFDMAWSHSQIILRLLNAIEADTQIYGRLAGAMIYAHARRRANSSVIAGNRLGPRGLWRFGISGDLPILLVRIGNIKRMDRITEALRAHAYWRMKGLTSDMVIINEDFSGYRATLNDAIMGAITSGPDASLLDKPGGVFVCRIEQLSEDDHILLQTMARVVLTDTAETLSEQVDHRMTPKRLPAAFRPTQSPRSSVPAKLPPHDRIHFNGLGGFTPDGREYVITLEPGQTTPAPWVNVIASPHIGTVVSESGGMYTWAGNAHEFRLTPWHNDPVTDAGGEVCYVRDEGTGRFWSLAPLPAPGKSGYVCRHGFGYSVFEHEESGIATEAWIYVAMDAPVKFISVKIRNQSGDHRRLSLTGFFELVLGEWRHTNLMHIITEVDPQTGAIFARNPYSREYNDRIVFSSCSESIRSVTGSRAEFIGRNGTYADPAAMHRTRLSGRTGAAFDPGAGIQTMLDLPDGQEREIIFTLGVAGSAEDAHNLIQRFAGPAGARAALESVWNHWNRLLGTVHVETPDVPFNILANGWLIYQTLSCRIWGRSGYCQSGGAYGFRDQLQDAMSLIHAAPWILREQLLRCAAQQFKEGDVQHWWHPPNGAGVRTHFSDDYLWLPLATARYVAATGDSGILDEIIPFLEGRPVDAHEESYYEQHPRSSESGTLYEHGVRAIRRSIKFGAHGLPLIGCGDWNDGMNLIGKQGKGESVWLAWFLYDVLLRFSKLAHQRNDVEFARMCEHEAEELRDRTEATAWDGDWYLRAYFDDGTPLGSAKNDECQIDSLSQSWAVLSGAADHDRAARAMQGVMDRLVRKEDKLLPLFEPPFDQTALEPGYIKGYPPGIRENGGQYTHGAIWSVMAMAMLGEHRQAWELFHMLNPIHHGSTPEEIERYRVEPYVMAADVYCNPQHFGRGGWTWYTGAAGWMYRLAVETLLGLEIHTDHLTLSPRLSPNQWSTLKIHYRFRDTVHHIEVRIEGDKSDHVTRVLVDGNQQPDHRIPLVDDRQEHFIVVTCGG